MAIFKFGLGSMSGTRAPVKTQIDVADYGTDRATSAAEQYHDGHYHPKADFFKVRIPYMLQQIPSYAISKPTATRPSSQPSALLTATTMGPHRESRGLNSV